MTKEEFWSKIELYGKSPATQNKIPPLILQANKENLSLLVVAMDGTLQGVELENKAFVYCVTSRNAMVPAGCRVGETDFDGLFFQLIDSGYSGLAFFIGGDVIGVEWSDIFPAKGSGKKKSKKRR